MVTIFFAGGVTPYSGPKGYKPGGRERAKTYEQRVKRKLDDPSDASFLAMLELLKDDGGYTSK